MCVDESMAVTDSFPVANEPESALVKTAKLLTDASVAELTDVKELVEKLMREQTAKEQAALKASIEAIAKATGVSVDQVLATLVNKKRGRKSEEPRLPCKIKYRHPEQPELTWTGRGKEPKWLNEAREQFDDQELLAA
jgi:DNA-binding protein H-NS